MRYTSDFRSGSKESYNDFCTTYSCTSISYQQYQDVLYTYAGEMLNYIIETGDIVNLPRGLGKISIDRKKTESTYEDTKGKVHIILPIDWQASKKEGKIVRYYNDHTDGYRFKFIWFPSETVNLKMKAIWSFKPARVWSRKLKDVLKGENRKRYIYTYTEFKTGRKKEK